MLSTSPGESHFTMEVENEAALWPLVVDVAATLTRGDVVTLTGDLGVGKTAFARALIRTLAADAYLEVPSPTFTLVQIYELPRITVVHADLYRVRDAGELTELGLDEMPAGAIMLIEWPERAARMLPPDRFDVAISIDPKKGPDYRSLRITGYGACAARVDRMLAVRKFLLDAGYAMARREPLAGDASSRSYDRLWIDKQSAVLMNAPRRPDGPPVRDGKPYSQLAHLAEDVKPFIAMANGLRAKGFSAPEIFAADIDTGFIVLEDLGSELIVSGTPPAPIRSRYEAAVLVLLALHKQRLPDKLPVAPHVVHEIPVFDIDAFLIEVELLLDWYLPHVGRQVTDAAREAYLALWRAALEPVVEMPRTWVLRDFHSPNLLWLNDRRGIGCLGLLDFQDAVLGPPAYDLASLLQDARVDVPEDLEIELFGIYVRARKITDRDFDAPLFAKAYATLAAQRASKILGIFARLNKRDHKPVYLGHLPRVWRYVQRALAHPGLTELSAWYAENARPPT
jgi:tRNA threonylcarbamoyl adenosine modification protein YjeE